MLRLPRVRFFRALDEVPPGTWIVFPLAADALACGFVGILDYRPAPPPTPLPDEPTLAAIVEECLDRGLDAVLAGKIEAGSFAGGDARLVGLWETTEAMKERPSMVRLVTEPDARKRLRKLVDRLEKFARTEEKRVADKGRRLDSRSLERVNASLVRLRDIVWAVDKEILGAVDRTLALGRLGDGRGVAADRAWELVKLSSTFDSLDRLEVRGRDSAGLSVILNLPGQPALEEYLRRLEEMDLLAEFARRQELGDFVSGTVVVGRGPLNPSLTFVFKVAAEVGKLGDNVRALRDLVAEDRLFQLALEGPIEKTTTVAHTRWASNGIINVPNCHPLDHRTHGDAERFEGTIQVVLNGDIDNYPELKAAYESQTGRRISEGITTDAKIIACWIEKYVREGDPLAEAFRKAVADFRGSAAIAMHSDLAPGKVFLSLKGSGQAVYVGLAPDRVIFASEVYGLVNETSRYFRLDGETLFDPADPASQGQIVVLDTTRAGGLAGISSRSHAGAPIELRPAQVRTAAITTRDIDRRGFDHYFLKEISESPASVAKTLRGKYELETDRTGRRAVFNLGEEILPATVGEALRSRRIRQIYLVGQGTASIAAMGIAYVLRRYLVGTGIQVDAFKASELSGFHLRQDMSDTLTIAVSQSGTTTDTMRAVDMVSSRGGATLAIVNRRGSDMTDKVDGVLYTSDGRDVEMSVASTKAFYSQVVAGAILSARLAQVLGAVPDLRIVEDLEDLSTLPSRMEQVLALSEAIGESARRLAPTRRHWAVVGSGPNHIAAQEVRIKLSELCYKSIACDHIEDKKHIDLSAEPLVLTLAAGNHESVVGDCVKDVAIFKAHKAVPVVFCAEGEDRFDAYAESVVRIPRASDTVSMLLNTVAGHLWGYHAALAIGAEGEFLKEVRAAVVEGLVGGASGGRRDPLLGSPEYTGRLLDFYRAFQQKKRAGRFQSDMTADTCSNLLLLFKYAVDHVPLDHFELEFGKAGSRLAVYQEFHANLNRAVEDQVRPIDAIKHQAKTVTVGTSRIEEFPSGVVFAALASAGVATREVSYRDLANLCRFQPALARCDGLTLYRVEKLDSFGNPDGESTIAVETKLGVAKDLSSRADQGTKLAGTKRSIVLHKEVFLGVGGDERRILILPLYDDRFRVARLALLHVGFVDDLALDAKVRVLGLGYEDIKNAVTEANVDWTDEFLAPLAPEFLLTRPAEHVAETIVTRVGSAPPDPPASSASRGARSDPRAAAGEQRASETV